MARVLTRFVLVLLAGATLAGPGAGQEVHAPLPPGQFEGVPIREVYVDLRDGDGGEVVDSAAVAAILEAFRIPAGSPFLIPMADVGLGRVRDLDGVESARWELYQPRVPGAVVLALRVEWERAGTEEARGMISTGRLEDFPTLVDSRNALLKLSFNGGVGVFDDRVPWWGDADGYIGGSPLFPSPAESSASWGEGALEAGAHGGFGILPNLYLVGSLTVVGAGSAGQDPWRSDARYDWKVENAYATAVLDLPDEDARVVLSYGPQSWQLNDGFLFSQFNGSFNAADWGATYLAARTSLEQSAFAKVRWSDLTLEGFLVDPQEYFGGDSGTEYRGINLNFDDPEIIELGAVYYEVPRSTSTYILPDGSTRPRKGLRTLNVRVATTADIGWPGIFLDAEYARQTHRDFDMAAEAWYAHVGYDFAGLPWQPSLSYRYGFFEGDDPDTPTYERFDAPQSSGQDNWLQGNILRKTVANSNVRSHRIRLGTAPAPGMNLTFSYFYLWADELNNRGGARPLQELAGYVYGQEVDVTLGWTLNRYLFLQALAGIAVPGSAIDGAVPGEVADNWRSLQLSLFWSL